MWGLYDWGLGLHPKFCELCFDTCETLLEILVLGFHIIVDEVLIVEGLLEVPIYLHEVGV